MIKEVPNNSRLIKIDKSIVNLFDNFSTGQIIKEYKVISLFNLAEINIRIMRYKNRYFVYNRENLFKLKDDDYNYVFKEIKFNNA